MSDSAKLKALGFLLMYLSCMPITSIWALADVIYLANGNVMVVEKAWEEGQEIKYQSGQGIQTLPKSSVRRIQSQKATESPTAPQQKYGIAAGEGSRAVQSISKSLPGIPSNVPSKSMSKEALARLRENLRADPTDAEAKVELAGALNSAAALQSSHGDLTSAKSSLEEALSLDRRNPVLLSNLAIVNMRIGNYRTAEDLLLACLEANPKDQSTHYLLGEAYYAQEKISQAVNQWAAALQLGPNPDISERLEKARQESETHSELGVLQSAHFILRYDRKVSDYRLGQQILTELESLYRRLSSELTSQPPATVAVILYPDQTYFDITRAPAWTGALFDGKIRVPTKGLASVTSDLSSTLVHELTHSFIASLPGRGCPSWLGQLQRESQVVPLKSLRGSFVGLPTEAAALAYVEGLSAVEFLVARFGKSSIRNVLELMAQNYNFENAFRSATHESVANFEANWQQSLTE
jgi:tetratricopeptide (TPR) repeat protein